MSGEFDWLCEEILNADDRRCWSSAPSINAIVIEVPTAIGKQNQQENKLDQGGGERGKLGQIKVERL